MPPGRAVTLAALVAALTVAVAVAAWPHRDNAAPARSASAPPRGPTAGTATTPTSTPGRPLGPPPSTTTSSRAKRPARGKSELDENAQQDAPPRRQDLPDAAVVARRFAAGWLAHAVGRAPLSELADALPELRGRLDVVRGRLPTTGTRPPLPQGRLTGLRRLRAANPRLLVASIAISDSRELRAADLLLVWRKQRWRVADLAPR